MSGPSSGAAVPPDARRFPLSGPETEVPVGVLPEAASSGAGGGPPGSPRRGRVAGPAAVAGLALALSLPPWGLWPLGFAGAGLLFWRLAGLPLRSRLLAGWLAGLGCYVPGLYWAKAFNWYGAAVLMALEALAMAGAAALVPPRHGRLPAYGGAFTLFEAVRLSWPFGGVPLGGVFLGQAGGPLLADARLGGPLLLTLGVWSGGAGGAALVAGSLAGGRRWRAGRRADGSALLPAARLRRRPPMARIGARLGIGARTGAVAVGLVIAATCASALAPGGGLPVGRVTVASVQGGGRRGLSRKQVPPPTVFDAQLAATRLVPRREGSRSLGLVVWPEDVVSVVGSLAGTPQAATISSLARHLHTTVLAGVTVTVSSTQFLNEAVAWGPSGRVIGTYEKVHRVPFGEYVPYRSFFAHLANLSAVPLNEVPGRGTGLLRTPAGPLGVLISYEVFFASRGRSAVRAGAQLLVVPTNTSSYATSQVPGQEVAADRVQAVEEGRDLVQAAPTGYSTVVRSDGAVAVRSALGARQVLLATVDLRSGSTLYERFGDVPVLALCALLLSGSLLGAAAHDHRPGGRDGRRRAWSRRSGRRGTAYRS